MTQTPPLLLRRYPSPRPFATRTNVGLIATGNLSRAERVSRVAERIDLAILYLAFVLLTYADMDKPRRMQTSRKSRYFNQLFCPPTCAYVRFIAVTRRRLPDP